METAMQPWLYASACLRYDLSTESGKTGLTLATGSGHSSSTATGHIKSKGDAAKRFTEFGKFIEWDSWVLAAARLISGTGSAAGIHEVAQCEAAPQAAGSGQAVSPVPAGSWSARSTQWLQLASEAQPHRISPQRHIAPSDSIFSFMPAAAAELPLLPCEYAWELRLAEPQLG